jgi:hypothetical protein
MDKAFLDFSEISLFNNAINELFKSFMVNYPIYRMLIKILSLSFFKLVLNQLHDLRLIHIINMIKNQLNIKKRQPLVLSLNQCVTGYHNEKKLLAEKCVLQFLKNLETMNIGGRIETISDELIRPDYQKYIEGHGNCIIFPNRLIKCPIGNSLYITTYKSGTEEQKNKDNIFLEKWNIEIESTNDNFDPHNYMVSLEKQFIENINSHSSKITNKAYQYLGKKKDDYSSHEYMEFEEIIIPDGWDLLDFHDKDVLTKILTYCDSFIKKYKEYELNKDNDSYHQVNFCFNMCITGDSGTGKTQLTRSVVKYIEKN